MQRISRMPCLSMHKVSSGLQNMIASAFLPSRVLYGRSPDNTILHLEAVGNVRYQSCRTRLLLASRLAYLLENFLVDGAAETERRGVT